MKVSVQRHKGHQTLTLSLTLFRPEFFLSMKNALAPHGLICTQGECLWLHLDLIANVFNQCKEIFPSVRYAYTTIPTYPSGQIGFIIASNDASIGQS
jgi:spermidine synthase